MLHQKQPPADPVEQKKLSELSNQSTEPLFTCTGIFPFTLFPDTIEVYIDKIMIIYRQFFYSEKVFPIVIKDLLSVSVSNSLLFASVKFELTLSPKDSEAVQYLPIVAAAKVHQLATGLLIAQKNNVDLRSFSNEEVFAEVERIGSRIEEPRS